MIGLKAMAEVANPDHPFRFVYTSGALTERNQDRSLWLMSEHRKMRVRRIFTSTALCSNADLASLGRRRECGPRLRFSIEWHGPSPGHQAWPHLERWEQLRCSKNSPMVDHWTAISTRQGACGK